MNRADVFLDGTRVGEIERFGDEHDRHVFRFEPDYLRLPARPVLGQLFEDRLPGDMPTDGFTPWFEHVLPKPQSPLRRAVARAAHLDEEDGLGLLVWLGDELPGAVRVSASENVGSYRRTPAQSPLPIAPSPFRMSLGGNQWKLSVGRGADDRFVLPLRGNGDWIAKFHGADFPELARLEHGTMAWARRVGMTVPETRLVPCSEIENLPSEIPRGDGLAFLVRRFDREPQGRVHVEDFGQVLDRPPGQEYAESFEAIAAFLKEESPVDVDDYVRRLVFMVVSGNADAHLKNWGVIYRDGRHARLGPCYDLVATAAYPHLAPTLALKLGGVAELEFSAVSAASFEGLARVLARDPAEVRSLVAEFATRAREKWGEVSELFTIAHRARMESHLASVRL